MKNSIMTSKQLENPMREAMGRTTKISDFLTRAQINQAIRIGTNHKRLLDELVMPNMAQINNALGQENDPGFIAYAIEYVLARL